MKPALFMSVAMAKANKVEIQIEKARSLKEGESSDVHVQIVNGKGKKIAKTKHKKSADPVFDESFIISDHAGNLKFQILAGKSSAVLYQLEIEVLNLGTFAVPKWHILKDASSLATEKDQTESVDPQGSFTLKGLTKVFGGPKLNLEEAKKEQQQGSAGPAGNAPLASSNTLISGPVIGEMDPDMAEAYEPYVLINLWDRPKVIQDHAEKVKGSGALVDQFLTKLQKIEETYAKQLADLATTFFRDHAKFKEPTLLKACYMGLVIQTKHRADEAKTMAEGLKEVTQRKQALLNADNSLTEPVKKLREDLGFLAKPLQKEEENLNKAQKLYDDFVSVMEKTNGVKIDTGDENWREKLGLEDKTKLQAFETNLRSASIAEAMVRNVYNEGVTREYAKFQQAELERSGVVSQAILDVGAITNKFTQAIYKKNLAVQQKYRAYNKIEDLEKWTSAQGSDIRCPWGPQEDKEEAAMAREEMNPFSRAKREISAKQNANLTADEQKAASMRAEREALKKANERKQHSHMSRALDTHSQAAYLTPREQKSLRDTKQKEIEAEIEREKQRQEEEKKKKAEDGESGIAMGSQRGKPAASKEESKEKEKKRKSHHELDPEEKKKRKEEKAKRKKEKEEEKKKLEEEKAKLEEEREKLKKEKEEMEQQKKEGGEESGEEGEGEGEVVGEIYDGEEFAGGDYSQYMVKDTPIVIDNGHAYFKAGFSGEMNPSLVIPAVSAEFPSLQGRINESYKEHPQFLFGNEALHAAVGITDDSKYRCNTAVFSDAPEDWGDLLATWGYLCHKLGANPAYNPVLYTIPTLAPTSLKRKIYEVVFEQFASPQSFVTPAPLLAPYAYGSCTGLVVDIGASSAQVAPVIDGYLIDSAQQRARHLGGKHDTEVVVQYLKEHQDKDLLFAAPSEAHLHNIARSMKDRMTFVPQTKQHFYDEIQVLDTVEGIGEDEDDMARASSEYVNGYALHRLVVSAGEKCFQPKLVLDDRDESIRTLPELVTAAVSKCANDVRIDLLSNIHLSGGVCTMPGFRDRFQKEIREILNPKARKHVYVHGDHESRFAVWRGGSVLTSLDAFQATWITSNQWEEEGPDRVCADRPVVSSVTYNTLA
uniref:C2 domain-containing protein n=1 Tax=Paramoeba aestuarina TaxID=180227 RepID=A0A7S4NYM6_9EUKA|mmetsp:Transcript_31604/g.49374  ORF Transcript_31604/g.49374 Transcript_31604/m.49374 type:complete len:1108 (+) Transcript_31604:151-3474(+)